MEIISIIVSLITLGIVFKVYLVTKGEQDTQFIEKLKTLFDTIGKIENRITLIEQNLKEDFRNNREEYSSSFKSSREELMNSFNKFENSIVGRLNENVSFQNNQLTLFAQSLNNILEQFSDSQKKKLKIYKSS
jgi:predicted PurR-regulated permease PerM